MGVASLDLQQTDAGQGKIDYSNIVNKPKINGVTLEGDLATEDLNIIIPELVSELQNDVGYITKSVDDLELYYDKTEIDGMISTIPKFSIRVVDELPTEDISPTTIYLLRVEGNDHFEEWVYIDDEWDKLGDGNIDLSDYATYEYVDAELAEKVDAADLATVALSGRYSDLIGAPTNLSQFTNDAGFITSAALPTRTSDLTNDGEDGTSTYVEASDLATVATSGSYNDLTDKPADFELVEMSYGESNAWAKFIDAYRGHKIVYCRASSNANPASGSQTRKAFMAYVNNADAPSSVEFQYVRSVSSKTASQPVDQVYVYTLTSANGGTWTVTTRDMGPKLAQGTNTTVSYSKGTYTISASQPTVNDATLTIQKNGTTVETFTANSSTNKTANIVVPTKTSDITNDSDFVNSTQVGTALAAYTYPSQDLYTRSDIDTMLAQISSLKIEVVNALPQTGNADTIYLLRVRQQGNNIYQEYFWVNNAWELIGGIDLTDYYTKTEVNTLLTAKADVSAIPTKTSDLTNDSNFAVDANYVHTDNNYTTAEKNKLAGIAAGAEVNVQSNWTQTNSSADDFIKNKPSIPTKTSDLTNDSGFITSAAIPTNVSAFNNDAGYLDEIPDDSVGLNQLDDTIVNALNNINNKANTADLAAVAFSGDYDDLTDKPTIPAAQVNSDWNASSGVAQILNKPTLATVATSGSYNDLSNRPTIPTVNNATLTIQKNGTNVQTFTANSSSNKTANITVPTATSELTNDSNFVTSTDYASANDAGVVKVGAGLAISSGGVLSATGGGTADAVAWGHITGTMADQTDLTTALAAKANSADLATVATSGSYNDLSNKPTIPAAQVNSDWNATSGKAQILNKPTKLSQFTNDSGFITGYTETDPIYSASPAAGITAEDIESWDNKSDFSGSYNDLTNKPTIGNATLTIQKNGTSAGTFTANATSNKTINITVPTTAADVSALPASTKYGASIAVSINTTDYKVTTTLKDQDGNTLGTAQVIDLPLESVVVNGSYDNTNKKIVLTLQNGNTVDIPVGDLIAGLQSEITSTNKLSSDLVDDTNHTHKFVTAAQITKLNGIAAGAEVNVQSDWNQTTTTADDYIKNKPSIPTKTSNLTNDSNFVSDASYVHTDNNYTTAEKNKLSGIAAGAEVNVQANWTQTTTTADDYIKNKPTLATVATSGSYNDLSNKPTIPTVNNATLTIQKNGTTVKTFTANASTNVTANITVPTKTSDITNDSNFVVSGDLATVATSGSYNDLSNKPTIPAAQVQSNWTQTTTTAVDYIKNKPTLATVATSGSYNDLSNKPTIPTVNNATLTIQKNGTNVQTFTANQSTNATANITVPTKTSELTNDSSFVTSSGTVAKANQLTTPRTIAISGGATGTATSFSGASNISIPITDVKSAYVTWGGKDITGDVSPDDAGCIDEFGHNKLAFLPAECIEVKYSTDGGASWIDYGLTDAQKIAMVTTTGPSVGAGKSATITASNIANMRGRVRIACGTLAKSLKIYTSLKKILINFSTNGATGTKVKMRYRTIANYLSDTNTWVDLGTHDISGWSGWNSYPYAAGNFGGNMTSQTGQPGQIEFEFWGTGYNSSYGSRCALIDIRFIGMTNWGTPSELARAGHLYTMDTSQNATFPASVKITGSLQHSNYTYTLPSKNGTVAMTSDIPASITVDSALSSTSTNPVQNKVINTALNGKQASLSTAQLNAANSGITSAKVTTYDGYAGQIATKANLSALDGKQDALTAGSHINITNDTISATGYVHSENPVTTTSSTATVTGSMIANGTITADKLATGATLKLTLSTTDIGEGAALAANTLYGVYR